MSQWAAPFCVRSHTYDVEGQRAPNLYCKNIHLPCLTLMQFYVQTAPVMLLKSDLTNPSELWTLHLPCIHKVPVLEEGAVCVYLGLDGDHWKKTEGTDCTERALDSQRTAKNSEAQAALKAGIKL